MDSFMNKVNMFRLLSSVESQIGPKQWTLTVAQEAKMLVYQVMKDIYEDPDYSVVDAGNKVIITEQTVMTMLRRMIDAGDSLQQEGSIEIDEIRGKLPDPEKVIQASPEDLTNEMMKRMNADLPLPVNPDLSKALIKSPWTHPLAPPSTLVDLSIDGFSRNVALHPTRFHFQHTCGDNLRNVSQLKVTSVQIPVSSGDIPMTSGAPYLLLMIDEHSALFDEGGSNALRRSFCKLVIDRTVGFPGGRQYAFMVPASAGFRAFKPPIAMLGRLTISVCRPDGGLVSQARDNHTVIAIYLNTDAAANWALRTKSVWTTDFQAGDVVNLTGINTPSEKVNAYLNREEGHRLIAATTYVDNEAQHDGFVIQRPYKADPITNMLLPDDDTQAELIGVLSLPNTSSMSAGVVNSSLQMSVSMVATCEPSARHESVL